MKKTTLILMYLLVGFTVGVGVIHAVAKQTDANLNLNDPTSSSVNWYQTYDNFSVDSNIKSTGNEKPLTQSEKVQKYRAFLQSETNDQALTFSLTESYRQNLQLLTAITELNGQIKALWAKKQ